MNYHNLLLEAKNISSSKKLPSDRKRDSIV